MDIDLDGDLDMIFGPGSHPLENMQPLFVYRNYGGDRFTNITPADDPRYYGKLHGMAFADVDRDGDADLYVNNGGVLLSDRWRDLFLENKTEGAHWLHLKLEGTKSNRSAIGARVQVHVGDRVLMQEVAAGQGRLEQLAVSHLRPRKRHVRGQGLDHLALEGHQFYPSWPPTRRSSSQRGRIHSAACTDDSWHDRPQGGRASDLRPRVVRLLCERGPAALWRHDDPRGAAVRAKPLTKLEAKDAGTDVVSRGRSVVSQDDGLLVLPRKGRRWSVDLEQGSRFTVPLDSTGKRAIIEGAYKADGGDARLVAKSAAVWP